MEPVTDLDLFALAIDGLDPGRKWALAERIAACPDLEARLAAVAREVAIWRAADPPEAPRKATPVRAELRSAPVLGARRLHPGELFYVMLHGIADAAERFLVVLRGVGKGWRWIYPSHPEELHPVDRLPEEDGARRLGLSADEEPGTQRWAVALPPLHMAVDWTLPAPDRWAPILAGVAEGAFPVVAVEVEVHT